MEDNGRGDIGNGRYIYKTWSTRRLFYTSGTHSISDKSVESAPEWRVRDAVPSWRAVEAEDFRSVRLESIMHHSTGKSCVNELSWTSESSRFFLSLSLLPPFTLSFRHPPAVDVFAKRFCTLARCFSPPGRTYFESSSRFEARCYPSSDRVFFQNLCTRIVDKINERNRFLSKKIDRGNNFSRIKKLDSRSDCRGDRIIDPVEKGDRHCRSIDYVESCDKQK